MKSFISLLIVLFAYQTAKSTDILVNETGSGGAYTTITAAHTAAVDGDRILVEPKAGGAPYIESFTITKSVQILCNAESQKFSVQGNITVSPSTVEDIAIIGLELVGNIAASGDASTAGRTIIKILYSELNGNIKFSYNNYDLTVANCTVYGGIEIRSGRVLGNVITSNNQHSVYIDDEASGSALPLSDTIQVIGNRITNLVNVSYFGISANSQDYFYQFNNNYFYFASRAIFISGWTPNLNGSNEIINNSIRRDNNSVTSYFMYLSSINTDGVLKVYNNLLDGYNSGSAYGFYFNSMSNGHLFISYNILDNGFDFTFTGITNDGTNVINAVFTMDNTSGQPTSGTYADAGHPDLQYYDHNLTRNDVGCYGGSMSASNFFPVGDANNNRVYMLTIPSNVYTGNPIRVEAESFDK